MLLQKIISGGQTGVDQAALDFAIERGIPCGGWCPPGRVCANGVIPGRFPLRETPEDSSDAAPGIPRSQRTEWNVRDADGTLVLAMKDITPDTGTAWSLACAYKYNKPVLEVVLPETDTGAIIDWIRAHELRVLNVSGPSENNAPGIGALTKKLLTSVISKLPAMAVISLLLVAHYMRLP